MPSRKDTRTEMLLREQNGDPLAPGLGRSQALPRSKRGVTSFRLSLTATWRLSKVLGPQLEDSRTDQSPFLSLSQAV